MKELYDVDKVERLCAAVDDMLLAEGISHIDQVHFFIQKYKERLMLKERKASMQQSTEFGMKEALKLIHGGTVK